MPREQITPAINARGPEPDGGHFHPLPTVQVGWQRDLGSVQVGLETPVRMVGGDGSSGQHHLLDYLYADQAEQIGDALVEHLRVAGWRLAYDQAAVQGASLPPSSATLGRMVLDAVTGADGGGNPGHRGWTGWYTDLTSRRNVNDLIRLLRKARDAAFGRDE